MKIPRGIRNNNPLNIRIGNSWKGEVEEPTDHDFEQFTEMRWGVRAAFVVLRSYVQRHKIDTVEKIIRRWAPSNENNTEAYIKRVCEITGYGRKQKLQFVKLDMIPLFKAMCIVENGQIIETEDIVKGWNMAGIF